MPAEHDELARDSDRSDLRATTSTTRSPNALSGPGLRIEIHAASTSTERACESPRFEMCP